MKPQLSYYLTPPCQHLNIITLMTCANYALAIYDAMSDAALAECVVRAAERMIT